MDNNYLIEFMLSTRALTWSDYHYLVVSHHLNFLHTLYDDFCLFKYVSSPLQVCCNSCVTLCTDYKKRLENLQRCEHGISSVAKELI